LIFHQDGFYYAGSGRNKISGKFLILSAEISYFCGFGPGWITGAGKGLGNELYLIFKS